jgi:hypothetical protein
VSDQAPNLFDRKRLEALLDSASKHAREMNQRAVQVSLDIGKEKTQYFEKIAIAAGGTIALIVSFVGAHTGRLQPPWLLRAALIALVLAMIAAMYRNWKYPHYLLAAYARQEFVAKLDRERCRRDCIVAIPSLAIEDGKPIDVPEYLKTFAQDEKTLLGNISKTQKQEDSAFNMVKYVEGLTLLLMVTGFAMLIALAWKNF